MNVLYVSEYFPPYSKGGGERSAKKLIDAVAPFVDKQIIITSDKKFDVKDIKRFFYFPLYSIKMVWKYRKKIDVVHCLNSTSIYTILLKPFIRKPFVIHVNSYVNICPKGTLIYKDQSIRRECVLDCTLKNCIDCCEDSILVGIKEMKISRPRAILLWLRYKFHMFLLHRFDKLIAISKQTENVLYRKGLSKVVQIYYGS